MIRLEHPDPATKQALARTLQQVWPDIPLAGDTDGEQGIVFVLDGPPRKLAQLVQALRQLLRQSQWPATCRIGEARLNPRTREWHDGSGEQVLLTEKEVAVLLYLWQGGGQGGRTATREDLLRDVWQYAADVDTHTIETHIYRLRQKIERDPSAPQFLLTTKDGYQLAASSSA